MEMIRASVLVEDPRNFAHWVDFHFRPVPNVEQEPLSMTSTHQKLVEGKPEISLMLLPSGDYQTKVFFPWKKNKFTFRFRNVKKGAHVRVESRRKSSLCVATLHLS